MNVSEPVGSQKSLERWFANLPNLGTRRVYLPALKKFVEFTGRKPDELVELGKKNREDAHHLLKMFYNSLTLASTSRMRIYQTIRSFYRANGVILGKKPRTYRNVVEYEPRRLYSQDEVAWLVDSADNTRDKALITFLAQSGQRVSVVVNLKMRHVTFNQPSPVIVDVPAVLRNKHGVNVNKAQVPYQFAFGEDTKIYLALMIDERRKRGEPLDMESWLFRSKSKRLAEKKIRKIKLSEPGSPLSISQVGNIIRNAASKRGVQQKFGKRYLFHPHGFRRYWKHQMRMGRVSSDLLNYMMGHVLPFAGAYDRWTVEDIKNAYKRAENYTSLRPKVTVTKEDVQTEVLKVLVGKIKKEDVDKISENLGIAPPQIRNLIRLIGEAK